MKEHHIEINGKSGLITFTHSPDKVIGFTWLYWLKENKYNVYFHPNISTLIQLAADLISDTTVFEKDLKLLEIEIEKSKGSLEHWQS